MKLSGLLFIIAQLASENIIEACKCVERNDDIKPYNIIQYANDVFSFMTSNSNTSADFENLSIKELWKSLENWYQEYCPDAYKSLGPPITTEELQELETELGVRLPADYKESLLVHNGGGYPLFEFSECYMDHKNVIGEWELMMDVLEDIGSDDCDGCDFENDFPEIRDVFWSSKWIPFTADGGGQSFFIDLDPTSVGNVGQVGSYDHESGVDMFLGKNFHEFFSNYVRDIYCGKYSIDEWGYLSKHRFLTPESF
ncbi:unnamed protein product [Ambrosiozyma monospora]|uniref:Unnamed protein product n=1 Tax=Ambrosiozyma monospora TaxID=43982 RepID=A0A9W6YT64_AMBMO|nr:unnamed protein product [Ambrosiozyma monospora]